MRVRLNRKDDSSRHGPGSLPDLVVYAAVDRGRRPLPGAGIPGPIAFEELATQAQVAMSVLWIVLGAIVFVFGLARGTLSSARPASPCSALASAKVFVFDLASLDVAYRVLSLMALGTFLLLHRLGLRAATPASARGGARRLKIAGMGNGHREHRRPGALSCIIRRRCARPVPS